MFPIKIFPVFNYVLERVSDVTLSEKLDYLCDSKPEISNICQAVKSQCLQAMKTVHHHANGNFDWLVSEHEDLRLSIPWSRSTPVIFLRS